MILHFCYTLQCMFPKTKDIFLHNHSTIFKIRKLILTQHYYLLDSSYSDFTNCPNNVNYSQRNSGSCITFSCCVSLLFFNVEVLRLSLYFMKVAFLKSTGQLFCSVPQMLGFVWHFLLIIFKLCPLGKNITERMLCSQWTTLGDICCWSVSLLVKLTLIIWWRWCLSCFSTVALLCYLLPLINAMGKIFWNYVTILLLLKHLHACFSIHWWLLPESIRMSIF